MDVLALFVDVFEFLSDGSLEQRLFNGYFLVGKDVFFLLLFVFFVFNFVQVYFIGFASEIVLRVELTVPLTELARAYGLLLFVLVGNVSLVLILVGNCTVLKVKRSFSQRGRLPNFI